MNNWLGHLEVFTKRGIALFSLYHTCTYIFVQHIFDFFIILINSYHFSKKIQLYQRFRFSGTHRFFRTLQIGHPVARTSAFGMLNEFKKNWCSAGNQV